MAATTNKENHLLPQCLSLLFNIAAAREARLTAKLDRRQTPAQLPRVREGSVLVLQLSPIAFHRQQYNVVHHLQMTADKA